VPWFYYLAAFLLKILFRLLTRWQVKGRENTPSEGPILVASNHLNLADPPLLGVSLGRKAIFMAKKELFRFKVIGNFVRGLGSFPVHRGQLDKTALHQANQTLADGLALIMFPEGTRSRKARLQRAFPGTALIAVRNGVPILPVGITGTEKIKGVTWILHRPKLVVNIGHPFHLPPVSSKLTKEELNRLTDSIMEHIATLLPPEYRGYYAERRTIGHEN